MILLLIMLLLDAVESMGIAAKGYGISSSDISRQRFEPRQVTTTSTSTPISMPTLVPNKKAGLAWSGGSGGDIVQFRVAQTSVGDSISGTGTGTSTTTTVSSAAATATAGSGNSTIGPETGVGVSWYVYYVCLTMYGWINILFQVLYLVCVSGIAAFAKGDAQLGIRTYALGTKDIKRVRKDHH